MTLKFDEAWQQNMAQEHRKYLQQIAGESLADAIEITKNTIPTSGNSITDFQGIIGSIANALFIQRTSHIHYFEQKKKHDDARNGI